MSGRDRRAMILGGVGIGLIALYLAVIEPVAGAYSRLVVEHEVLARKVAREAYTQKKNAWLAEEAARYERESGPLAAPKPYGEQVTAVGEQIVAAAMGNGVQLKGTSPAAPVPWPEDQTLQIAQVRIEADAEWEKVFAFLAALYRANGVLSVEQMELTSDPKKGGRIQMRLSVSVLAAGSAGKKES